MLRYILVIKEVYQNYNKKNGDQGRNYNGKHTYLYQTDELIHSVVTSVNCTKANNPCINVHIKEILNGKNKVGNKDVDTVKLDSESTGYNNGFKKGHNGSESRGAENPRCVFK